MSIITAYTAADNSRIDQLRRFAAYFRAYNPNEQLKVIPFGDEVTLLEKECKQWDFDLIQPNQKIDQCGKLIFGKQEYRPGVSSWRYMRKLNCFVDSQNSFVFFDVNNLFLSHIKIFAHILKIAEQDVLFSAYSKQKRTINSKMKGFYEALDEHIGDGYNCSIIVGKNNLIYERDFELLSNPNLIKFFKKAPEQGYLAILLSLSRIKHNIIQKYTEQMKLAIGGEKRTQIDATSIDLKKLEFYSKRGEVILNYKTAGAKLVNMPEIINNEIHLRSSMWLCEHQESSA